MIWLRRSFVGLLSLLLLLALLGGALAASAKLNLTHPAKIQDWLSQSQLYDHFVDNVIDQSKQSDTIGSQAGSVSLNDTAVQQAAKTAFPTPLLQQYVSTFLDSNYAWLEGKTATPNFTIDLTAAKQSFARQVGQYVQVYTAGLPVCSAVQLAALQNQQVDPLSATCRPSTITPTAAGLAATQTLSSSGNFLSNPVITASTINPKSQSQSQPYYVKLARLPKAYQLALKLPLIFGIIALICALGIIFIAPRRRAGLRRLAFVLMLAGLILVAIKLAADFGFQQIEKKVFNTSSDGQLQQSLTNFAHRVESALVKTDLLFGIAFIVLAVILLIILLSTRSRAASPKNAPAQSDSPLQAAANAKPVPKLKKPQGPRPPRLIQ